jgi:hypothetical protein
MPAKAQKPTSKWKPRENCLVVLPDQGAARKLSPDLLGTKGRDRTWNAYIDSFLRANGAMLNALDINVTYSAGTEEIEMSLKANGMIGAIPLRAPDTHKVIGGVVVEPRYGWGSVGSLFSSIGWSAAPEILKAPMVPGSAREIPPWVIAGPAVRQLEQLLQHSGPRFREVSETRATPRGQIQWQRYATEHLPKGDFHKLPCTFSDLDADLQIRRYIRWALEKLRNELTGFTHGDIFAQSLWDRIETILNKLNAIRPLLPNHRILDQMQRTLQRQTSKADLGIEAMRWIIDDRGLAGSVDLDGLSWRIQMHELFEQWVETLVRNWAREFGGKVSSGRKNDSHSPISWERPTASLSNLIPDVVVQTPDETFIFDAKYKGFLDETDDLRWRDTEELFRQEHRHDLHQVLCYASLFNSPHVIVVLVYPVRPETWQQLFQHSRTISLGKVHGPGRQITVALAAIPIELHSGLPSSEITNSWSKLRAPLEG